MNPPPTPDQLPEPQPSMAPAPPPGPQEASGTDTFPRVLSRPTARVSLVLGGVAALLLWAYWTTLGELVQRWSHDPQYSHGYLVPAFALFLLWQYRAQRSDLSFRPCWWGVLGLALGTAVRLAGTVVFLPWVDAVSLLICLGSLGVLLAGPRSLRWSWPAIAFLLFMLPLPYRFQVALAQPLQRLATHVCTYLLQTLGFQAFAEGNIIAVGASRIGVVEACNGLSMLVTFFALSTAVAILVRRHWIHRILIVLSAVPVAVAANVLRILATAILHETVGSRLANVVFHDLAGWLMMPLALALMGLEFWVLKHLLVERTPAAQRTFVPLPGTRPKNRARSGRRQASRPRPQGQPQESVHHP